ncbi:putative Ubiquitin domain protein [Taphrina deformans PYCC 5710]|uniref:Ubiquitin domain protein n=1 Tax=Taphrina deformans (strain PYCC 5710 / ATCC 11124 / CBS 356.35 / IMI 108563 / JCM 9778 / NBRC 8474) TaxID=1097556 RepID=S0BE37_TAPDE|nr:putative Ubiquitin domain protein [Taphrina deformans PYCC 5710]|eukprot:CCG81544.1 putative Ubiquitin domain protein [Taphrina deformans PYCC 5710]
MGSCLSSPGVDQSSANQTRDTAAPTTTTSSRRQHRDRERTSLERRNTEARHELIAGRGEAPTYRKHGTWVANPPVTRKELEHARLAFWETADTFGGRKEVWDILRAAVNCDDVNTASTMLKGADLRLLGNGDLIHGCYDPTGFFYKIPENCLSDPSNLQVEDTTDSPILAPPIAEEFPESQLLDLKVRLSHNSQVQIRFSRHMTGILIRQDLLVKVALAEKVSSVSTKIQAATGVKSLKLMVLGRMLKDDGRQTLKDAGWTPGLIVQGLVTQA